MTLELQISPLLHAELVKSAEAANVTLEEFLLLAAAEKIASMDHHRWLTSGREATKVNPCGE